MLDNYTFPNLINREYTRIGSFKQRNGVIANTYVDVRAALLENPVQARIHLLRHLVDHFNYAFVGTGVSGALILSLMSDITENSKLSICNPKGHGVEWSPQLTPGTKVILLDDLVTTGGTFNDMTTACESIGLIVVKKWSVMEGWYV
jgi:orotate phosphoribosyltransferase